MKISDIKIFFFLYFRMTRTLNSRHLEQYNSRSIENKVKFLVHDYLIRNGYEKTATLFENSFGPFLCIQNVTLEDIYDDFKNRKISQENVSMYEYLMQNSHDETISDFLQNFGSLENLKCYQSLEKMFNQYIISVKDSYEKEVKPSEIFNKCRFCEKLLKTLPKLICPICEESFSDKVIFMEHYGFSHKVVHDFASDEDFKPESEKSICEIVQKKKSQKSEFSIPCLDSNIFSEIPSQKNVNSKTHALVYDFLVRNYHTEVSIDYKKEFGPFENLSGLTLETVYDRYIKSRNNKQKF